MEQTKKQLWEERLLDLKASGLSGRAWSKEKGIPVNQVYYWTRKLRSKPMTDEPNSKRWVGLEPVFANDTDTGVSICIGHVTLAVKRGFDHRVLAEVVRTLMTIC